MQYFQIINTFSIFDVETLEEFAGLSPISNATLLTILTMFFYMSQDLQKYFTICSQYKTHTNMGFTLLAAETLAPNQPNFKFLLESMCQIIAIISNDTLQWAEKPITKKLQHSHQKSRSMVAVDSSV